MGEFYVEIYFEDVFKFGLVVVILVKVESFYGSVIFWVMISDKVI